MMSNYCEKYIFIFVVAVIIFMILHLQSKVYYLTKSCNEYHLLSSKAAQLNITHGNGDIPNALFTADESGNLREIDIARINSLVETSIENRAKQVEEYVNTTKTQLETKITNAQRNSRKDKHDIRIGNKWLSGNNDGWIRITTGEGNATYAEDSGLACKNLWSNGTVYIQGDLHVGGQTFSAAHVKNILNNSLQKGTSYNLRSTNTGDNHCLSSDNEDLTIGSHDMARWKKETVKGVGNCIKMKLY